MTLPTVVITSAIPWAGITARPHHLALQLAERGWDVIYVDGPITWISPLRRPELRSRLVPTNCVTEIPVPTMGGEHQEHATPGRLRVLSPMAQLPFGNLSRRVNHFNQRVLAYQINRQLTGPCVLLSMLPGSVDLVPHIHPTAVLYDCVDFHAEFPGFVNKDVVNQMEEDLVHVSRTVFATADILAERVRLQHPNVRVVQNAADVEHFQTTETAPLHPLLADIPAPRVGMIGGIGPWIDQTLISFLAMARPNVQFVMVGPVETDISGLSQIANVHFLGRQPYAELPQFLRGFSGTLVPFRVDDPVAKSVNPIKVYEYIAAGCEVIATPIPELQKMADVLWLTPSSESAVDALDQILRGERRQYENERRSFVSANSWTARVDAIEHVLRQVLPAPLQHTCS